MSQGNLWRGDEDDLHQVGHYKQRYGRTSNCQGSSGSPRVQHGDKRGELFAGTPGLMALRTVISRAMTKCENGAKRSIMLTDVKTAFLYGDATRSLHVELPPEDPLSASGRYVGKLEHMNFKESVTPPGGFNMKLETCFSECRWTICCAQVYVTI